MFPLVRFLLQICEKYREIILPIAALRWKKRTCKQLGECKLQNMTSGKVGTKTAFNHNSEMLKWSERQKVEINKNKTNNTQLQKQRQTTK